MNNKFYKSKKNKKGRCKISFGSKLSYGEILKDIHFLEKSSGGKFSFGNEEKIIKAKLYKKVTINEIPIEIFNYPGFVKYGNYILQTPWNQHIKLKNKFEGKYHMNSKIKMKGYENYTIDDKGVYDGEKRILFIEQVNENTDPVFIITLIVNLYYCLVERYKAYNEYGVENIDPAHARAYIYTNNDIQSLRSYLKSPFTFLEENNYQQLINLFEKIEQPINLKINKKLTYD